MNLKEKIVQANTAYRSGTAIISDAEYDLLLEEYSKLVSKEEFIEFQNTLHEATGKIKHPYVMGSLDKVKADDTISIEKFINKHIKNNLHISAKVDGISCRLHYENGKLVSATTRGNGTFGQDITDKIKYVRFVQNEISIKETLDIRGELVIYDDVFEKYFSDKFSNARNTTAGLINRKEFLPDEISKISFICYTILGPKYTKQEQFTVLKDCGFNTTFSTIYKLEDIKNNGISKVIDILNTYAEQKLNYTTDGLVICDVNYINEDKYRPESQVAFKINQQVAVTKLIDVVFEGPSENGSFIPVAVLEPVEIGGVVVQRCTLHNLDFIEEKNLKYGCEVSILRSGDVIPKLISVLSTPDDAQDIVLPDVCPSCGTKLELDGINYRCKNPNCEAKIILQLSHFIKKLGVKSASEKTLVNLKITSFDKLLDFCPNSKYKSQVKLYEELKLKVFTRSEKELLAATNFNGLSEILINKIVDFYGLENIKNHNYVKELPLGIGEITLRKFQEDVDNNLLIVSKIINDSRYNYSRKTQEAAKNKIGSVCFTGKLFTMSRSEASELAENKGYEVKNGVTKDLTYLVTNDTNSNSSKNKKAKQLNIKVISEDEFLKLVSNTSVENEIEDL